MPPDDVAGRNTHCDAGLDDARALLASLDAGAASSTVASRLEPCNERARQVVNGIYLGRPYNLEAFRRRLAGG